MFKNVMVALGLGPDEDYEDRYFDDDGAEFDDHDRRSEPPMASHGAVAAAEPEPAPRSTTGTVGAVRPIRSVGPDDEPSFTVRPISRANDDAPNSVTALVESKPRSIAPQSFGDAKVLADEFKRSTPVVMQLTDVDRELARRLIDFASGVCYSLGGSMEKLATNVFLLLPKGTEVSADDRRRIEERGFDR